MLFRSRRVVDPSSPLNLTTAPTSLYYTKYSVYCTGSTVSSTGRVSIRGTVYQTKWPIMAIRGNDGKAFSVQSAPCRESTEYCLQYTTVCRVLTVCTIHTLTISTNRAPRPRRVYERTSELRWRSEPWVFVCLFGLALITYHSICYQPRRETLLPTTTSTRAEGQQRGGLAALCYVCGLSSCALVP